MSIITKMRIHTAVYWPKGVPDGEGGYAVGEAVEIDCRWQDVQEEFIDTNEETRVSKSVVFPDQKLDIGGWLFRGKLIDLDSSYLDDPQSCVGTFRIEQFASIPNLKGTETLHKAFL